MEKEKGFYYGSTSSDPKGKMESNFISDTLLNNGGYFQKSDLEFARYKQDCRKRALDLAHAEVVLPKYQEFISKEAFTIKDKEGNVNVFKNELLISMADKYYQWLITIPQ